MQSLKQSEINLFLDIIKTSTDTSTNKRGSQNLQKKISRLNRKKQYRDAKHFSTEILLSKLCSQNISKPPKKSFYQLYKQQITRKIQNRTNKGQKRKLNQRASTRYSSNQTKLKQFQFNLKSIQNDHRRQYNRCIKSEESSPIRKSRDIKKQKQILNKLCTPKAKQDALQGVKKSISDRYQTRLKIQQYRSENIKTEIQKPFYKFKIRCPKRRPSITETLNAKKLSTQQTSSYFQYASIDAWQTQF